MFSKGNPSVSFSVFRNNVDDLNLLTRYFGMDKVPALINSPFREDRNPSFALFYDNNGKIRYKDFSSGESGDIFSMLGKAWNMSYMDVMRTLIKDDCVAMTLTRQQSSCKRKNSDTMVEVKVRRWLKHDIEYWKSFGISIDFLKFAEVYPISHIFFIKENDTKVVDADKYAYVYVERRNGIVYKKIYQPLSKNKRYKWFSKMNGGIISLYDKIPENGDMLFICSSLKDALCMWENTGYPCIALQGEGYSMLKEDVDNLKSRFKKVVILFDIDKAGILDAKKLSEATGFEYAILPTFEGGKDVSDLYKALNNKEEFKSIMSSLLSNFTIPLKEIA